MDGGIVGLSGSVGRPSRTRVLVEAAVHRAAMRYGRRPSVIGPPDLSPSPGSAAPLSDLDSGARSLVESIVSAEARTLATGVHAFDDDFGNGAPASAALLDRAVARFAPFLNAPLAATAAPTRAHVGGGL
ncbi:hypothetical protein [uncultured Amaricoccus sp.]|uniref:hypothetical protein n=1 Tax=uncultured Amaricoccus sp. TaxID=339341 RepID=UPI002605797B|nr:hypothetical protein [uncultured Amaricoccus sp.]